MILAVDTSLGSAVAVVGLDGSVRGSAASESPRGHAEVIGDLLVRALAEAGATPGDITHVAAGMGPGPFTGLRIGIAAARAFAQGRGLPVIPVVSHDAIAFAHLLRRADDEAAAGHAMVPADADPTFSIVTDARRREWAVSSYTTLDDDGIPLRTRGPELEPARTEGYVPVLTTAVSAGALGALAARMIAAGRVEPMAEPLYLRSPDVVEGHTPKRVSA
ncbi:tRNA (adenosine(37)-N6)-threonylcarbamoyltransferase complex dimerization subunit type 1 TsaB [Microbacterium sediminis]|uniref:tRNA N6-adenosine(37)-N6-threonylcarbamoyltransferase complex dimerization subunit TsaB n=1 Tax=Microbacterium sediminis TaxID=904291 RepID=A0A1B9NDH7_9MICO|nr:tRNA (adenosine(37)-N6)-threonylcarbamoyltransferase complex dimerization subunit type 1 TsaB [Microbacterium sediminis]OCG74623.1 tRNA N6-adenosine(37)-N6-threonylcarbamoyltransferase complex dimerization subunit TsaB [Microbacterium sediminis]QBR74918.1 tRNA (adenosine(37)-N6)-threonylcarbamoyltransferase complex dimerization subunit type 1 TsaB [Microbacterium sediminis]